MLGNPRWIYAILKRNLGLFSWPALLPQLVVAARHLRWCICRVGRATGRSPGELCWLCWPAPPARRWAHSSLAAPPPPLRPSSSCSCHYAPLSASGEEKQWHFRHITNLEKLFFSSRTPGQRKHIQTFLSPQRFFYYYYLWLRLEKTSTVSHCQGCSARHSGNSAAVEIVLYSVNIFPSAIFFLSPALFRGPSLYPLDRSTQAPVLRWLYPSLPPLPPPPILSFLSGYPVIAEAQCDPGLNTHPTQTLHPHVCPRGFCDWQGQHYNNIIMKK